MAKDNVTSEDLKATAQAKLEDVQGQAQEHFENAKDVVGENFAAASERVRNLNFTLNQKLVLVGAGAVVASVSIQQFVRKYRDINVAEVTVLVSPDDIA